MRRLRASRPRERPSDDRKARARGSKPSSLSCESVRAAPASGCIVPWNMLNIMNQIAAVFAKLPATGANVGPRTCPRSPDSGSAPSVQNQTTGRPTKKMAAMKAAASTARGTLRF